MYQELGQLLELITCSILVVLVVLDKSLDNLQGQSWTPVEAGEIPLLEATNNLHHILIGLLVEGVLHSKAIFIEPEEDVSIESRGFIDMSEEVQIAGRGPLLEASDDNITEGPEDFQTTTLLPVPDIKHRKPSLR